jgi:hypothetical protein
VVNRGWGAIRDARRRVFGGALIVALALHLPLTPLASMWNLLGLRPSHEDWDYQDGEVVVPVTFDLAPTAAPAPESIAAPPSAEESAAAARALARSSELADGGLHDAATSDGASDAALDRALAAALDAASSDAGLEVGAKDRDGGSNKEGGSNGAKSNAIARADAGADGSSNGTSGDSLGLASTLERTTNQQKANVVLVLWTVQLRGHPLGRRLAALLGCNPQWRDFLGNGVDPLADFDGIMLSGPRFSDSSKVTVMVQTKMAPARIRDILGGLVTRSGPNGRWLETPPGELGARFRADRADRVAATHPRDLLFITPPEGYEQIRRIREPLALPADKGRAVALSVVNPWRPARRVGLVLPETLSEMRLEITPRADGGAELSIRADDADPATAARDAAMLHDQLGQFSLFIGDVPVSAAGATLQADLRLSRLTSSLLLGMIEGSICPDGVDAGLSTRPLPVR